MRFSSKLAIPAAVLLASLVLFLPAETAQPSTTTGCNEAPVSVTGRTGSGSLVQAGSPGAATVSKYADGSTLVVPPDGIIPANVPLDQRLALGLPAEHYAGDNRPVVSKVTTFDKCPSSNAVVHASINYNNWAGRRVYRGGTAIHTTSADWHVPTYYGSYCLTPAYSDTWVGVDSSSAGGDLYQDGFGTNEYNVYPWYYNPPSDVAAWYEDFPSGTIPDTAMTVASGDSAYAYTYYDAGSATIYFVLENLSSGVTHQFTIQPIGVTYYPSSATGEFISERLAAYLLRKSSQVYMGSESVNSFPVNDYGTQDSITMVYNSTLMNDVNGTTTQSNTWLDCGPGSGTNQ